MRARALGWLAVVLVVLVGVVAAAGFFLVPHLAMRHLPPLLQERLGRAVDVGSIRFNPFLLHFEAEQVSVEGRHGQPLLAIARVGADASMRGLLRGTWVVDELRLEQVKAHVVMAADGSTNVAQVLQHWSRTAGASDGSVPKLLVRQFTMPAAQVDLTSLAGAEPARVRIDGLGIRASNLSTLAEREPAAVEISAALAGQGRLQSQGQLRLQPSVVADARLQVSQWQVQDLLPFMRPWLRVSRLEGTVDVTAHVRHGPDQLLHIGDARLSATGVHVAPPGGAAPLLQAARVVAEDALLDVSGQVARIGDLRIEKGSVRAGGTAWADLLAADPRPTDPSTASGQPWTVELAALHLGGIDVAYADRSGPQPLTLEAEGLDADLALRLTVGGERTALVASDIGARWKGATLQRPGTSVPEVAIGPTTLAQGRFDLGQQSVTADALRIAGGQMSLAPAGAGPPTGAGPDAASAPWNVTIASLSLAGVGARYGGTGADAPSVHVDSISATLGLEAKVGGAAAQVLATGVQGTVEGAAFPGPREGRTSIRLERAQVAGGHFDLAARQVRAGKLTLTGAATLVRGPDGRMRLPGPLSPTASVPGASTGEDAPGPEWRYAVEQLQVPSFALAWVDRTLQPAFDVRATLSGQARNVASGSEASFEATLALAQGGRLSASGTASLDTPRLRAKLDATGLALAPFQPLLETVAALTVDAGQAFGSGDLRWSAADGSVAFDGRLGLADLLLNEAASGDRFLSWKRLEARGTSLRFGPRERRMRVGDIEVQEPGAKIVISPERELNLMQILKPTDAPAPDLAAGGSAPGFTFGVDRLRLQGGEVDFTDLSLVLPFSTTVRQLEGTVVDISSDPGRRASIRATGAIEPYGSAAIEGSLVPVEPSRFTDLGVEFNNVPVPPLSPYTATFAGRKVESGRLWLDLEYRVERGELLGRNQIRLQDFKLGERVQAPDALDIPLDLAVALLADADGNIRFSVPVTGELGDARFSVASAVRQALGNVLKRAVSAPFRVLGSLFGGGEDDALGSIDFRPGSASLRPEQREKLDALTRALRERPQLNLLVEAPYDPQRDAAALQRDQARRALARALGRDIGAQEDPGPFSFDDPATQRALGELLRSTAGDGAVQALQREWGTRAGLYEAMFDRIAAQQPVPGHATQVLAADRAREIATYLQSRGIDPSRVRTGALASVRSQREDVSARLQVAAASEG